MIADGFYKSLPIQEYLAEDALSKSGLSDLSLSPAHYQARKIESKKFDAANLGSAVHMLVLEPEKAEKLIITPPAIVLSKNGSKNTNAYRDWLSVQDEQAIILGQDEFDSAQYMRDAVISHPAASELLQGGNPEVSMLWTDGNDIRRKCRPDYLAGYYVDIKTARSAKPEWFGKQAYDLHYHWSAAWTIDIGRGLGSSIAQYLFVVVEKEPPWAVSVFDTPKELIDMASNEIATLYHLYKTCIEFNHWPGYSNEIENLTFPHYAFKKEKNQNE